jgi:hypothetical protein
LVDDTRDVGSAEVMAQLYIPLTHPMQTHSAVMLCALRGQEVTSVKVTATQLVICYQRKLDHGND